jgi:type VI secretion system secreted protein VgrG
MPGATFEVVEHAVEAFNQELTLLAVTHRAEQTRVGAGGVGLDYGNEFEAQDANLPVRPALRTPIPTARLETATVVGPAGEEIHVDKYGRVKVHFHWDREGSRDDKASCGIRCAQAWAGAAWGASLVPRVGQEVLVRFLGGDPDRPLVVGTVYNGMNPPPLSMPGEKTRSTLRSDSSPGGQGGNELRLEDQAGSEQVYLHAQHDQRIRVENDETALVRGAQTLEVSKDRTIQVHGNQQLEVAGSEVLAVDASQTLTVAGGRSTVVLGMQRETMAGQQVSAVGGERSLTVALAGSETVVGVGALTVGAAYSVAVGGLVNLAVGGLYSVAVARDRVEVVGAARQEMVASDSTATLQDEWVLDVDGQVGQQTSGDHDEIVDGKLLLEVKEKVIWTAKEISLEADQLSFVVGGNVALAIDRGGNVTFGAKGFAVDGSDLKLKGSKLQLADAGSAASATSSVPTLDPLDDPRAAVELTLNDQNGDPIRNEPYRVELPDGIVKKGFTDAKGHARVSGKERGSAKVTFPQRDKSAVRKG